jgi:hypothetical protein
MRGRIIILFLVLLIAVSLSAQDFGFGFGFDDEETSGGGAGGGGLSVSVGGEISASMVGFFDDFSEGADSIRLGDIFAGSLYFTASSSIAEGVINLNLQPAYYIPLAGKFLLGSPPTTPGVFSLDLPSSPISIDEAYLRAYLGGFDITAGLRKLTWGKADSFGPLDVINPLDSTQIYTEMADSSSLMGVKIARPLVHISFRFGQFSKIEGVFVPNFEPYSIAEEGRWMPAQMKMMQEMLENLPPPSPPSISVNIDPTPPDTTTIDYAQAGLRFTTTIGPVDLGLQYYYGRLPQPSVKVDIGYSMMSPFPVPSSVDISSYLYNPYHQIGLDYAQVLFGFNVRAEFAANITKDLKGDDGSIYNPSLAWSFGFDRNLFLGINLNLQINESIRLMHDQLGSTDMTTVMMKNNFDIEGGSRLTATRLTATLSKKFLRDELEFRTAVVWGIEDKDCLIMPALVWTKDDLRFAFAGGVFAGSKEGQLGQYRDNNFLKLSLTYTF